MLEVDAGALQSRAAILAGIRAANGDTAPAVGRGKTEYEKLPRDYVRDGKLSPAEVLVLFEHRLIEYDAQVFRTDAAGIGATVRRILSDRKKSRMLVPAGLATEWLPDGFQFRLDDALSFDALDRFEGVVTAATVAVATTGSIALQHGPGEGRRALSLIPDYHLCIVFAGQVVETLPEAFARLDPVRPTTFISGPSATADIEMTRIKGVHGPRFLDVVIVTM
jgi:L-lactate dehydrogenase complex protein LldG